MPKAGGIPEKTSDFNSYLRIVVPHLSKNRERLRMSEEEMEELSVEWGEKNAEGLYPSGSWNYLYDRRINSLTSTSVVKKGVREKRLKIDKLLRQIYRWGVFRMTIEDLAITGRKRMPSKRSRAPVPGYAPDQYVREQRHTVITLCFRDPKFPSLRRMPPAFPRIRIECEINMGERGYLTVQTEYSGKSIFHFRLQEEYVGKQARFRSRYTNTRGDGPWSYWLNAIVI